MWSVSPWVSMHRFDVVDRPPDARQLGVQVTPLPRQAGVDEKYPLRGNHQIKCDDIVADAVKRRTQLHGNHLSRFLSRYHCALGAPSSRGPVRRRGRRSRVFHRTESVDHPGMAVRSRAEVTLHWPQGPSARYLLGRPVLGRRRPSTTRMMPTTATISPMESHIRLPVMKLPGIRFIPCPANTPPMITAIKPMVMRAMRHQTRASGAPVAPLADPVLWVHARRPAWAARSGPAKRRAHRPVPARPARRRRSILP